MVEYNVVKKCRLCDKRFVVDKKFRRQIYCKTCQKKITRNEEE